MMYDDNDDEFCTVFGLRDQLLTWLDLTWIVNGARCSIRYIDEPPPLSSTCSKIINIDAHTSNTFRTIFKKLVKILFTCFRKADLKKKRGQKFPTNRLTSWGRISKSWPKKFSKSKGGGGHFPKNNFRNFRNFRPGVMGMVPRSKSSKSWPKFWVTAFGKLTWKK